MPGSAWAAAPPAATATLRAPSVAASAFSSTATARSTFSPKVPSPHRVTSSLMARARPTVPDTAAVAMSPPSALAVVSTPMLVTLPSAILAAVMLPPTEPPAPPPTSLARLSRFSALSRSRPPSAASASCSRFWPLRPLAALASIFFSNLAFSSLSTSSCDLPHLRGSNDHTRLIAGAPCWTTWVSSWARRWSPPAVPGAY